MNKLLHSIFPSKQFIITYGICLFFFLAYTTLSLIRHLHYGSFGYDLGISDQITWEYSRFLAPITTVQHYPFTSILTDHIEFIYPLLSPLYWIFPSAQTLLIAQAGFIASSGVPIFLLTKQYKLKLSICYGLLISYFLFYGIQNAIWFDVQSLTFAAGLLPWFIYFLTTNNIRLATIFFLLAIACKEDLAYLTLFINFVFLVVTRKKYHLYFIAAAVCYLIAIFLIYFPYFTHDGYRYRDPHGILSDLHITYYFDTADKQKIIFYSFASVGFIPIIAPLYLLPFFGDLTHYFIFGHAVPAAQTFFMHYRVTLALFMLWPTIIVINKYRSKLNNRYIAAYIIICALLCQYVLHSPLSYLTKPWFWQTPASVTSINAAIQQIPPTASVVAQNNITPHISHRTEIFTLLPNLKIFSKHSPCGKSVCQWFQWAGNPHYLIIDTGSDWDIRHFLENRPDYLASIHDLQASGYIKVDKQIGTTTLYTIVKHP